MIRMTCAIFASTVALAAVAPATAVLADETGLASMHNWRKERGRTCMADHWHYGTGNGPTRRAAERDAAGAWSSFTAFEYGSRWASFSRAASKKMTCSQGSGGWTCNAEARPCR